MSLGNLDTNIEFNAEMSIKEWITRLYKLGTFYGAHRRFKFSDTLGPEIREKAPVVLIAPTITGTAQEDEDLAVSTGTWYGSPTYTYQWLLDGEDIEDETATTYTVLTGDVGSVISCTVTATNAYGAASSTSADTEEVVGA